MSAIVNPPLEGFTTHALRDHLADAESKAELAEFIDDTARMLRERAYWLEIARQIRAEIKRRQEPWGGIWPKAQ